MYDSDKVGLSGPKKHLKTMRTLELQSTDDQAIFLQVVRQVAIREAQKIEKDPIVINTLTPAFARATLDYLATVETNEWFCRFPDGTTLSELAVQAFSAISKLNPSVSNDGIMQQRFIELLTSANVSCDIRDAAFEGAIRWAPPVRFTLEL